MLSRSTLMLASLFHAISEVCAFEGVFFFFLATIIHICHLRGMKGKKKIIVFVVISAASARQ